MGLTDYLPIERVLPHLRSTHREEVLDELVQVLPDEIRMRARQVLAERESLGSTGIGGGIAIPHGRLPGLETPLAVFGRSSRGVEFASMDGEPVFLFFVLLGQEGAPGVQLKALARTSRLLSDPAIRAELYRIETREGLHAVFDREE
jgi:PTS system nitrogen regulatory IIA component